MQAGLAVQFPESFGEPPTQGGAQALQVEVDVRLASDAAVICEPRAEVVHEGCCAAVSKRVFERPPVERLQGVMKAFNLLWSSCRHQFAAVRATQALTPLLSPGRPDVACFPKTWLFSVRVATPV